MRLKVTETIKDYEGKALPADDGELTFRGVFSTALNNAAAGEDIPAEQKGKLFAISVKLFSSSEVNLTSDEVALVKERVGKVLGSPLVYGRVLEFLGDIEKPSEESAV